MMNQTRTILIADDDADVIQLLTVYLRGLDCEILTASDGEQALAIAKEKLPDIALLDVGMPKKNGWEVCQALKALQRTADIAVVLVTGRGEVKDRLTGLQMGADDYLVKPFAREQVVKRVSALLAKVVEWKSDSSAADAARDCENLMLDRATALPTLPLVLDRLKETLIDEGELGILYIDIEHFEAIEGEYGWAYFDEFLRSVGELIALEAAERVTGAVLVVNRIAASSFYMFVPTKGKDETLAHLETLSSSLRARLAAGICERFPNMSSGQLTFFVSSAWVHYEPQIRLERQIYNGMQAATDAVRDAEMQRHKQLKRELKDIIRKKRITILFQPIVWARDSSVFGYEVLTRGPAGSSFLNSDMLFQFARDANLSWELEAIALESTLAKLKQIEIGDSKFLINLEAEMFELSELKFHELVAFFERLGAQCVFELTERAAIADYAVFRKILEDFRTRGIEIAIDDAGSGYASLEAIVSLAPDYLKITKGLVSALANEPIKQDLVRMLVELAHKIDARTIAEGIETEDEFRVCRDLGVDLIQGYLIAKPKDTFNIDDQFEVIGPPPVERRAIPRPRHAGTRRLS